MAKNGNDIVRVGIPNGIDLALTRDQAKSLRAAISSKLRTVHKGGGNSPGRPTSPRCACGAMTLAKVQKLQLEGNPHVCFFVGKKGTPNEQS